MFIGFELSGINLTKEDVSDYKDILVKGRKRYISQKRMVETVIDSFVLKNGNIDGTKMQANWFPQVKVDIFLSHSHNDEDMAIFLSEVFRRVFGLEVFIDSCLWGYADDLLKIIDDRFCLRPDREIYDYKKRNRSTSHVHMMLTTALTKMMDNAECVMFLNTPNSVTPEDTIKKTGSPWIYAEIAMTQLIRHRPKEDYRFRHLTESFSQKEQIDNEMSLSVEYTIPTHHLISINGGTMADWVTKWPYIGEKYSPDYKQCSLDVLYNLTSM